MSKCGKSSKKFKQACDQYFQNGHKEWSSFFDKWETKALAENVEGDEITDLDESSSLPPPRPPACDEQKKRKTKKIGSVAKNKRRKRNTDEVEEVLEETKISFKFIGHEENEEEFLSYLTELSQKFSVSNPFLENSCGNLDSSQNSVQVQFDANNALEKTVENSPYRKRGMSFPNYSNEMSPYRSPHRNEFAQSFDFDSQQTDSPARRPTVFWGCPSVKLSPSIRQPVSHFLGSPQRWSFSPRIPLTPTYSQLSLPPPESWTTTTKPVFDVCTVNSTDSEDETSDDQVSPPRKVAKVQEGNLISNNLKNLIFNNKLTNKACEMMEEKCKTSVFNNREDQESSDSEGILD